MKVIGLTDEFQGEAKQQCAEGFRAWIAEAEQGTWGSWEELKKHYPKASRTNHDEAHFPLATDGTGVRALVFFELQLLILCCIAAAPLNSLTTRGRQISLPPTTQPKHAKKS